MAVTDAAERPAVALVLFAVLAIAVAPATAVAYPVAAIIKAPDKLDQIQAANESKRGCVVEFADTVVFQLSDCALCGEESAASRSCSCPMRETLCGSMMKLYI